MSTLNLDSGRVAQKLRTRSALLEAAHNLTESGAHPSVAEVADAAKVSRATAYRYFPSQDALRLEAAIAVQVRKPEEVVPDNLTDPGDRAAAVQGYLFDLTVENESAFRAFMAAVLQEWVRSEGKSGPQLRGNRRHAMIERALAPVRSRLDDATHRRLFLAISALSGMEAFLALTDVAKAAPDESRDALSWAVRSLIDAALDRAKK